MKRKRYSPEQIIAMLREGLKKEDDSLPGRFYEKALLSGHIIGSKEMERLLADYYKIRSWVS